MSPGAGAPVKNIESQTGLGEGGQYFFGMIPLGKGRPFYVAFGCDVERTTYFWSI